jgi:phosphoribosylglycinamide formyltransferase 1
MHPADGPLLVVNMAVSPDRQGNGIGSFLLRHAEQTARSPGLDEIQPYTNAAVASNLDFFGRRGYQEFGHGRDRAGERVRLHAKEDQARGLRSRAMGRKRVAILISGRGSNMAALVAAARNPDYPAEVAVVLSNRPDAGGLQRAAAEGVATGVVDRAGFGKDRAAFEQAMEKHLDAHGIDLVCLAGFMSLFSPGFVSRWRGRMLNIHPSLLPSFRGLHSHEQALAAGVRIHGATVHYVAPEVDAGPIVAQAAVPVLGGDTPDTLADRVLAAEHRLYPLALGLVAGGVASLTPQGVVSSAAAVTPAAQLIVPDPRP